MVTADRVTRRENRTGPRTSAARRGPAPSSGPRPPGRAGRDLRAAVAVGVSLGAAVVGSLYIAEEAFVGLVVLAIVLAVYELGGVLAGRGIRPPLVPIAAGSVAMLVGAYTGGSEVLVVALALTVLAVLVWRVPEGPEGYVRDVTVGSFAAVYVPFLAGFALLLLRDDDGPSRVLTFIAVTIASDIGGYAVGVVAGRHPMAPSVSPKKSWEGFAGSVLACVGVGVAAVVLLLDGSPAAGAALGAAVVLSATLGDLGESMIKRDLGIKDMGHLLPGHGGVMDRLDSLLLSAPVAWVLLSVLVPA